jgi:predicted glycosyltransferase
MGVGHVFRATRIVAALSARGFDVHLVYGGARIPYMDGGAATVHYLPPLRAGTMIFSKLETPEGLAVDDAYKLKRRDMLLAILRELSPEMIITEAFPFGRRQMRFELIPLLQEAVSWRKPPFLVASVRDILQENRKPERDIETVELVEQYFDHVLLHGDPNMVRLEDTFPQYDRLAEHVLYTGIVAAPAIDGEQAVGGAKYDVLVSVGGGVMGSRLLLAAAGAKQISTLRDARWCIITGVNVSAKIREDLKTIAPGDVEIRDFIPNLRVEMARAQVSISRAGYNTVADIFRSGCRAIVVPLSDGEETEQLRRAEILAARGLATVLRPEEETPEALAAAIARTMAGPPPERGKLNLEGARTSAKIVSAIFDGASLDAYR